MTPEITRRHTFLRTLAVSANRGRCRGGNLVAQNEISCEMKYVRNITGWSKGENAVPRLAFQNHTPFHGQKEQSANKRRYKSPPRINNKGSLAQHARMMQGLQGNCKHVAFLPALSVISLTFLICEEEIEAR